MKGQVQLVVPVGAENTGVALAKAEPSHHAADAERRRASRTVATEVVVSLAVPHMSPVLLVEHPAVYEDVP